MVANGAVALGDVGDNVPDVRVIPAGQGQFAIEFTSGMMDFQYAVARALTGLDKANADLGAQPQTVVSVASLVGKVLRQWACGWQDWTDVLLGFWLAVSPWQLEYSLHAAATENACGLGAVLVIFNLISACRRVDQGQEIFNILLGTWLLLSPFSLDFAAVRDATINTMMVGGLVVVLAVWQIFDGIRPRRR